MSAKRNAYIDILKGIACIGVVFMHCEFPGLFGELAQAVVRWSVPLFFTVSGYFCLNANEASIKRKIAHIGKIAIGASIFYLIVALLEYHSDLASYFKDELSVVNICAFVAANSPVVINGHLWFLFALLYVYVIYGFLTKTKLIDKAYFLIPVLLVLYYCLAYGTRLAGMEIKAGFYRNWLFVGMPFFLFGSWLRKSQQKIAGKFDEKRQLLLIAGILSIALSIVERLVMGSCGVHICSVITIFTLFTYCVLMHERSPEKLTGFKAVISSIGDKHSMMIYILHPAVFMLFDAILIKAGIYDITAVQWIRPVNTLLWTILLAMLYDRLFAAKKKA